MLKIDIKNLGRIYLLLLGSLILSYCGSGGGGSSSTSSGGGGDSGSASTPSGMSVGDTYLASFSNGDATISFSGVSGSASYELLIQSAAENASTHTLALTSSNFLGKNVGMADSLEEELFPELSEVPPQIQLDALLREQETYYENEPWPWDPPQSFSVGKAGSGTGPSAEVSAAWSADEQKTFIVLNSLTDTTQTVNVTATAKCVKSGVTVFIDNEILTTNPTDLPQSDIDTICNIYQTNLSSLTSTFGSFSDINNDGVVVALITSQVNKLSTGGGIVTGFFWSGDLVSGYNNMEIVYLSTPDSAGVYGPKVSNAFAMSNFLPGVFFHETQHLINYYQHVVVKGGTSEKAWLNEGLSHLAEDLIGYNLENYSRYDLYLAAPHNNSITPSGSPSLAQRGGIYLMLRYLYEQSGNSSSFVGRMVQTSDTGATNVVNAYAGTDSTFNEWGEFLKYWATALAYTDRGKTSTARYKYKDRTTNATTGNYHGACMICTASDNRSTVLTGPTYSTYSASTNYTVRGSTTRFLQFSSTPSSVTIDGNSTSSPQAVVIRVQ